MLYKHDGQKPTDVEILAELFKRHGTGSAPNKIRLSDTSNIFTYHRDEDSGHVECLVPLGPDHTAHIYVEEDILEGIIKNV